MKVLEHQSKGFTMLEVLVSIIVLSLGVLGAAGMLLTALKTTNETAIMGTGMNLAREYAEKLRGNKNVAIAGAGNPYLFSSNPGAWPAAGAVNCLTTVCTPAQLAQWDRGDWAARVNATLPNARVVVCFDSNSWDAGTSSLNWACDAAGTNLVVKLGWAPRADANELANNPALLRPRVIVTAIPGAQ